MPTNQEIAAQLVIEVEKLFLKQVDRLNVLEPGRPHTRYLE
jgi:hypothetical protein